MRHAYLVACGLGLTCGACSQAPPQDPPTNAAEDRTLAAADAPENASSLAAATGAAVARPEPVRNFSHAVTPEKTDDCDFEERSPSERPKDFVPSNFRSNVIFYQRPKGPLWSHVYADGLAIAELRKGDLIVAARVGRPDLWIRPVADGVTLEAGPSRLTCYSAADGPR